jgi:hypothetical protein
MLTTYSSRRRSASQGLSNQLRTVRINAAWCQDVRAGPTALLLMGVVLDARPTIRKLPHVSCKTISGPVYSIMVLTCISGTGTVQT